MKIQTQEVEFPDPKNPYDFLLFKIKAEGPSKWYELTDRDRGKYRILSVAENGEKRRFRLEGKEKLIFQDGVLTRIFAGSHIESINLRQPEKQPDSFWSGWKTTFGLYNHFISFFPHTIQNYIYRAGEYCSTYSPPWSAYRNTIHPALLEASLAVLSECKESPEVVEICGGDGEFARQIIAHFPKPMRYYLLEYNERSLRTARNRPEGESGNKIIPIKTDITDPDDYFEDSDKQTIMKDESIDLIIGSGALTVNVIENPEIGNMLKKIEERKAAFMLPSVFEI